MDPVDLTQCDREPIHVPGSIQPHGVLLGLEGSRLRITHVSQSSLALLGHAPSALLDRELASVLGAALGGAVSKAAEAYREAPDSPASFAWSAPPGASPFAGHVHLSGATVVLELEPVTESPTLEGDGLAQAARAARVVRSQDGLTARLQAAAEWFRRLTGYHRVMIYRFHEDWHGEVVAESRREDLEPFLGLHYPASDIPVQARALYLISPTRVIVDVDYTPSLLLSPAGTQQPPLDLSRSMLRSVSPVHLEYLRNMGVRATLTASLVKDGQLWGLVSCHHQERQPVSRGMREIAEWLAQDLSTQVALVVDRQSYQRAAHLKQCREDVLHAMRQGARLATVLTGPRLANLLDAVGAEGAALVMGGEVTTGGACPPAENIRDICNRLATRHAHAPSNVFVTDCLSHHLPDTEDLAATAAGFGMFPLEALQGARLVWFRGEHLRSVTWGGNPDKAVDQAVDGRLSPRRSFAAWTLGVRLRSKPWLAEEVDSARELGSMLDIELLRVAEEALKAQEVLLKDVLDSLDAHIAVLDGRGFITTVNRAWTRFAEANGGNETCRVGVDYLAVCERVLKGPESSDARSALRGIQDVMAGRQDAFSMEYPCHSPTEKRWFAMRAFRLSGRLPGAVLAHEDVTASHQANQVLRESESHFRNLFEGHATMMVLVDPRDGAIVDVNPAVAGFYGFPRKVLRQMNVADLNTLPPANLLEELDRASHKVLNTFVGVHRLASGEERKVEVSSTPLLLEGKLLLFSIIQDITAREEAADAMARERQRYRSLMAISQDGIHLLDEAGNLVEANDAFLKMLDYPEEAVGQLNVRHWDVGDRALEVLVVIRELLEKPRLFQTRHRRWDGSILDVEVHAGGVELEGRRYLLAASRDISARKEAERKLEELNHSLEARVQQAVSDVRARDRMLVTQGRQAAMGEMVGNIAHQWRQPLSTLGLVVSNLQDEARLGELSVAGVEQAAVRANQLIQKMSSTINDFRNFFRPSKEKVAFSVLTQVRDTLALLEGSFQGSGITVVVEAPADVTLTGFPNEYSQVVLNLLSNAREAIQSHRVTDGKIVLRLAEQDGLGCLAIRDNGGGIAPDVMDRISEPYFSTKENGTGIGLYMSRQIIGRNMGGRLDVENVEGGAQFTVCVPLAPPSAGTGSMT